MVKVSDVLELLKYHYNTNDVEIIQITDRNGEDIQIWNPWKNKQREIIKDVKIEFDCLLTLVVDDMYEDEQLDDIILQHMSILMREIKLKNILES